MKHLLPLVILNIILLTSNALPIGAISFISQSTETSSSATTSTDNTNQWTAISFLNAAPEERRGHSSIVMGNQLWIFGGCYLDQKCFNDFHSFDTETNSWTTLKVNGIPPAAREGHTATVIGSTMYLFGGSGNSAYYNDLYAFNLETQTWSELSFQGPKPTARANHGAVVDLKGRILIFGGYTQNGYSNEVYLMDPIEKTWGKPFISGTAPTARESFSITRVRNSVWIFGGFTDGGVLSDIWALDLEQMSWSNLETFGTKPPGRQSHGAVLQGENLILFGGCNYKINTCYSDTYNLKIDTMWWSKVSDENTKNLQEREDFSTNVIGANIYVFAGCKQYEKCYNDMVVYNTGVPCPNNCNNHGVCRNNRCVCSQGYFDNDCSLAIKCPSDCNGRGECQTSGKCSCSPGYTGDSCDVYVSCPLNCTDATHGTCLSSGKCQCNPGFSGDGCENGTAILLACPNSCSGHGTCDTKTGICLCDENYSGDDCSSENKTAIIIVPIPAGAQTSSGQQTSAPTPAPISATTESQPSSNQTTPIAAQPAAQEQQQQQQQPENKKEPVKQTEPPMNETQYRERETELSKINQQLSAPKVAKVENKNQTAPTVKEAIQQFSPSTTFTSQMFGGPLQSEKALQAQSNKDVKTDDNINQCPNACTYKGLCRNGTCYCTNGFTGEDCSVSNTQDLKEGESVEKTLKYAGGCLAIGILIAFFSIMTLLKKSENTEYMNIQDERLDLSDD